MTPNRKRPEAQKPEAHGVHTIGDLSQRICALPRIGESTPTRPANSSPDFATIGGPNRTGSSWTGQPPGEMGGVMPPTFNFGKRPPKNPSNTRLNRYELIAPLSTSKNLSPQLAGRKTVFENRRILRYLRIAGRVARANRKQFDASDDEDRGFERCSLDPKGGRPYVSTLTKNDTG